MARRKQPAGVKVPPFIWILLIVLGAAVAYRALPALRGGSSSHHPDPRPDVTAASIVPAERYAADPSVARVYTMARQIPNVLDGLFCYCECARNFGHRSLLSCFESDHGADCDVCLREAALAAQLAAQGKSLDEIRAQIDALVRG